MDTLTDTGGDITDRDINGEMMIGPQNQDLAGEGIEVVVYFFVFLCN